MRKDDFSDFCQMLDDAYSLLSRGQLPGSTAKAMFFRALSAFPIEAVRAGFDAHVKDPQRGRFAPTPADIVAQIEGLVADDSRPGTEEAWALACRAGDESETVVWSDEMAQAFAIASPLIQSGDSVGARMAFKESYARLVEDARKDRKPVSWSVSLGHDAHKRHSALVDAETRGLLSAGEALRLSPPQGSIESLPALLLTSDTYAGTPETIRERVEAIKALLGPMREVPNLSELDRERTESLKRKSAEAVEAYLAQQEST